MLRDAFVHALVTPADEQQFGGLAEAVRHRLIEETALRGEEDDFSIGKAGREARPTGPGPQGDGAAGGRDVVGVLAARTVKSLPRHPDGQRASRSTRFVRAVLGSAWLQEGVHDLKRPANSAAWQVLRIEARNTAFQAGGHNHRVPE